MADKDSSPAIPATPASGVTSTSGNAASQTRASESDSKGPMTSSGTLSPREVGSPSGPVPVSVVTSDPKQADKLVKEVHTEEQPYRSSGDGQKIDKDLLDTLRPAEIRSVASDRGYKDVADMTTGSRSTLASAFLRAQSKDEAFKETK